MQTSDQPLGRGLLYRLYQNRLRRGLDPEAMPRHVAMIIDGNRRWAKQLGYDTAAHGHRAGAAKMREFLEWCDDAGRTVRTSTAATAEPATMKDLIACFIESASPIA